MTKHFLKPLNATRMWIAAALLMAAALVAATQFTSAQQSVPPPNWTRSHDYDVQHYRLNVSFDWKQKMVMGETTITLRPFANNFKQLELDAGDMTIKSVTLAGGKTLEYKYDGKEKLRVMLDHPYAAGQELSVTVGYSAVPKKPGLVFITPNESDSSKPYQIWSGGESELNHYWFPCYDYPNDRATSELLATVEDKYQVISNGALIDVKRDAAKKTATYHWKMEQPFSSYLISIVVGEFAEIKQSYAGIPISTFVPKNKVEDGRASLGKIDDMMKFFSEQTGVKYPYAKYAQIAVRDFPGGLENITATSLLDTAILSARARLDNSSDGLIAHELSHQWFGDYLTCRDWSELWLNESFATYFAHLYAEHDKGRDEMLYGVLKDQQQYLQNWAQGKRRPIVNNRYTDPDATFDVYAYQRGGAVLHMLRFVIGDEAWWKAINHYLKTNALKNVETTQLKIAIEEATGQNLAWFFDQWVLKMGHPEFEVSYTYDDAAKAVKLKVKQTQKAPERSPYPVVDVFQMPVEIGLTTASGERVERVWIDKAEQEFSLAVEAKPLMVSFDRGNYLIKTLKFEKPKEELIYQVRRDADVMGRIWAASELKKFSDDEVTRTLGEVLAQDAFWGAKIEAARTLSTFRTKASKAALMLGAKDAKSAVRREVVRGLGLLKDKTLDDFFISVITHDQSYDTMGEAAIALGATESPKALDVLVKLLDQAREREVVGLSALQGLRTLNDPRAVTALEAFAAKIPNDGSISQRVKRLLQSTIAQLKSASKSQ